MNSVDETNIELNTSGDAAALADDFVRSDGTIYGAHWHIFVPTMVVTVLYLCGWLLLLLLGRGDGALAKLFVLVLAVGVPLLGIHAFLRFNTTRIQICDGTVRYHKGWPKRFLVDLPFELVEQATVRRGLSGRLFGGGTLVLRLTTGDKVYVADLGDPDGANDELHLALAEAGR